MAELPSTCTSHGYKDNTGAIQVIFSTECYYPGSNCILTNDQCVSVFKDTGCKGGDQQYQCAQAYYLKQQVQVPVRTSPATTPSTNLENSQLKAQLLQMQSQIDTLASKKATSTEAPVPTESPAPFYENPILPYSLLGILIIGIVILVKLRFITVASKT